METNERLAQKETKTKYVSTQCNIDDVADEMKCSNKNNFLFSLFFQFFYFIVFTRIAHSVCFQPLSVISRGIANNGYSRLTFFDEFSSREHKKNSKKQRFVAGKFGRKAFVYVIRMPLQINAKIFEITIMQTLTQHIKSSSLVAVDNARLHFYKYPK